MLKKQESGRVSGREDGSPLASACLRLFPAQGPAHSSFLGLPRLCVSLFQAGNPLFPLHPSVPLSLAPSHICPG